MSGKTQVKGDLEVSGLDHRVLHAERDHRGKSSFGWGNDEYLSFKCVEAVVPVGHPEEGVD